MADIGLWHGSPCWAELLRGEGVQFVTEAAGAKELPKLLVLDSALGRNDSAIIRRHIESGNALLSSAEHAAELFPELRLKKIRLRYIEPDGSLLFRNTGLIMLDSVGHCPDDDSGFESYGKVNGRYPAVLNVTLAGGNVILLPFELSELFSRTHSTLRQFYAPLPRLPFERVAAVDRGGVRRLVVNCLKSLLFRLGLPYIRLSYVPGAAASVFGFRVDTDETDAAGIDTCLQIAQKAGFSFTWFIHTGALPAGADVLARLISARQDVQLHCAEHRLTGRYATDLANFRMGLNHLHSAGVEPCGVAAPYGIWSPSIAQLYENLGFVYSSEFGYSWDTIPSRPVIQGRLHPVLQIPVHPVSLGSLFRAKATATRIISYFRRQASLQLARMEPCFLYDHPSQMNRQPALVGDLLLAVTRVIPTTITMTDYARWWLQRERLRLSVSTADRTVAIDLNQPADNVWIVIEQSDRFALAPAESQRLELELLSWNSVRAVPFDPATLAVLRPRLRAGIQELIRKLQRGYW
ncbi:MAG: hypothetical protein ABIK43_02015 [candidate division WOR-3 bacterium]